MNCKNIIIDYILLIYIIAFSGFMSFFFMKQVIFYISPIIIYIFYKRKIRYPKIFYLILLICFVLFIVQYLVHKGGPTVPITQTYRLFIISLITLIILPNFKILYSRIIFIICVLSLILWSLCQISNEFQNLLILISETLPELRSEEFLNMTTNPSKSLYIYTINTVGSIRNSGPFWEPGIFTVFITLALLVNLLNGERLSSLNNIILLLTNVTTFSTTGYIATMILIIVYIFIVNKNNIIRICSIIILPVLLINFLNLDFMQNKILNEMNTMDKAYSRFGAIIYHLEKLKLSPLIGYGANDWPITSMDYLMIDETVSPNGISIIPVIWGIPIGILFIYFIYKSTYGLIQNKNTLIHFIAFIIILTLVFSQDITNREFFFMLAFIGALYCSKEYTKYSLKQ